MHRKDKLVERRLQDAYLVEPPESLHRRLIDIPEQVPQAEQRPERSRRLRRSWFDFRLPVAVPALSVAAAVALLLIAGIRVAPDEAPPDGGEIALTTEQQAVRDFVIAMTYLQASTARVNRGVQTELGSGLMAAFERGEQSFKDSSNRVTNGG